MARRKTTDDSQTITVRVASPPRGTFFERDDLHPNGEAWVRGDKEYTVGKTRGVLSAIASGRIVMVDKEAAATDEAQEAQEAAEPDAEGQDTTDAGSAQPEATEGPKDVVDTTEAVPNVLTEVKKSGARAPSAAKSRS